MPAEVVPAGQPERLPLGLLDVPPAWLHESPGNPRRISDERFADLKHALERRPDLMAARPLICMPDGEVIAGNMRHRAVTELGWSVVPVFVADFTDEQRREAMLLDNAPFGEWVPDELAALVAEHRDADGDLRLLGFSQPEVEGLLRLVDHPSQDNRGRDPDIVPMPPAEALTQPGDLWILGAHRLVCGDATDPAALERAAGGAAAACMWTDPPYNVAYDPEKRATYLSRERQERPLGAIKTDAQSDDAYLAFLGAAFRAIDPVLAVGAAIYVAYGHTEARWVQQAFEEACGWYHASDRVWVKTVLTFGRADYHWRHECILYGWKPGAPHRWLGDRTQTTVIEVAVDHYGPAGDDKRYRHPTQKPIALIEPMLENSSAPGDVVLDPFGGSGSTLIACERLGRSAALVELDPHYCDVIVQRWCELTGGDATREDGLSWRAAAGDADLRVAR